MSRAVVIGRQSLAIAAAVTVVLAATGCMAEGAQASLHVYWTAHGTIGRANLTGSAVNQRFLTVRGRGPFGVAVSFGP